jgi:hypothetical protein
MKKDSASGLPASPRPALRKGVDAIAVFLRANPAADDNAVIRHLTTAGLSERDATKLVQFVPIAFTRFLYRSKGILFAPNYVLLGPDGKPAGERPIADEPAYREAWGHCEQAASDGQNEAYFVAIAARSGGYRAIQELMQKGANLDGIMTGPPVMWG